MAYLVLARKYRPQTFSEVIGQDHVTRTLANAFASGRVHHAFLFCGPRGCGKTTLARIVGKALNCEQGPSSEPCGTCSACASISAGSAIDYQEMDGASNRGIDAIRELTEAVRYQPANLRKKVYVIDEVHMLTTEAFNALLKTLEEPPPHVTFVLATTEPHKLPNTILSRCQRYDFKLVPASRLGVHLMKIFEQEKLAIDPGAVSLLVRESGGSVRDALSLSDQLISYVGVASITLDGSAGSAGSAGSGPGGLITLAGSARSEPGGSITERHVAEILGVADRALTRTLVRSLASGDAGVALGAVESAIERGVDEVQLARAIVRYLRDLSVLQVAPDRPELVDAADEERSELLAEAGALDRSRVMQMFERMLRCCDELGKTLQPRLVLDCALIDVATVEPLVPLGDLIERLGEIESRLVRGGAQASARPAQRPQAPAPRPQPAPAARPPAPPIAPKPEQPSATVVMAQAEQPQPHPGGGTTPGKSIVAMAADAGEPSRKQAPSFATGTAPGQRAPAAPPVDDIPHPASAGQLSQNEMRGDKQQPGKGKPRKDLAAGTGVGGANAEVAAAISDARAARDAALASPKTELKTTSGPGDADVATAISDARAARDAALAPPNAESKDGRVAAGSGQGVPNRSLGAASGPVSMAPSGPVPAAATVASGSGPTEQLTAAPTDVLKAWNMVLGELETRRKFSLLGPFQHARVMKWNADLIELGFPVDVHSMGEMAGEKQNVDDLRGIIRELGPELNHVKLVVRLLDASESGAGTRSVLEETREKTAVERTKRESEAREHPITKHVLQTFGAQIKEIKTDV